MINMRLPGETAVPNAERTTNNGLAYVNIPVDKAALSERQVDELDAAMRRTEGPYLLHCATGARADLLLALNRAKQHDWTSERTFDEAHAIGFNLRGMPAFACLIVRATAAHGR